jgi:parallel beta-helix repeat protein
MTRSLRKKASRNRAAAALTAVLAIVLAPAAAGAPTPTLVVDRDGVQCGNADFTSIQAAVDAAEPGSLIRVCPDLYAESVVIDKPLTLTGDPDAVEAIDCFQPAQPELGADRYAIVDPAGAGFSIAFTLAADDVALEGFVVQGATVGVDTPDSHSGYRIHHNLIRLNTLFGVDFGSDGTRDSRVDHNCLRDNRFGLVSELDDDSTWRDTNIDDAERARRRTVARNLTNARIDHNLSFRQTVGLETAGPGLYQRVRFDHNASRADRFGIAIQNSRDSAIVANELSVTGAGIAAGGENSRLQIADNRADAGLQGLGFAAATFFIDRRTVPSTEVLVARNVFTGLTTQAIVARPSRLSASIFLANVTSDSGDGIHLQTGNTGNTLRENVAERNTRYGIWAEGATENRFELNTMLGNGILDARDDNRAANAWTGNICVTDFPDGVICGG